MRRKFHFFAINHDYIKIFVVFYVSVSAILAVFFGLFYFLIWILFHIILEVYKRYHIFGRFNLDDLLITLQHCKIDLMFLCLGMSSEALVHHSFAVAMSSAGRYIASEARFLEIIAILPRVIGTAKVTKSITHILKELFSERRIREENRFRASKSDYMIFGISVASIVFAILIMVVKGYSIIDSINALISTLKP